MHVRWTPWLLSVAVLVAAASAVNSQEPLETASAAQGHLIAVGGGPGGAGAACFTCHGLNGQGDAGAAFPRLAGLDAHYLAKQLEDYASGTRPNEVMTPIAYQLSHDDRISVALYYAGLPAQTSIRPEATTQNLYLLQRGATLYAQGLPGSGVQACTNCHGPGGRGLNRIVPAIAGQPAAYIEAQLRLWRDDVRRNDIVGMMSSLAAPMSDEDIRAAAAYIAGLPP